jgi:hypothetical protein
MSDPADKNFDNPADDPYAPKSVRPANPQGGPGTADIAFPRFMRSANQQGSPDAENEIPQGGMRPPPERNAKLWRKSLAPEIMLSSPSPWNPWWPITIVCAVALGTAIGVYIVDGATWRKALGFGTNTTETTSRLETPKSSTEVSSPAARLPIASASQPTNAASPAAGPLIASAIPQPTNAGIRSM